jgi:hypothetical protein
MASGLDRCRRKILDEYVELEMSNPKSVLLTAAAAGDAAGVLDGYDPSSCSWTSPNCPNYRGRLGSSSIFQPKNAFSLRGAE